MTEEIQKEKEYDVLDMNNYKMEKLPVRDKSKFEKTLMKIGSPLAIVSFISTSFDCQRPSSITE